MANPEISIVTPNAKENSDRILGLLTDQRNKVFENLEPTQALQFFDDVVMPALVQVRYIQNQANTRKVSDSDLQKFFTARRYEVSEYMRGRDFDKIAADTGILQHTARTNIFRTIRFFKSEHSTFTPEYFSSELLQRYPETNIAEKPKPKRKPRTIRAIGQISLDEPDTYIPAETLVSETKEKPQKPVEEEPVRTTRTASKPQAQRAVRTTRAMQEKDSVGQYLDEIVKTPLLDAAKEVELAKTIEAGLVAENLLEMSITSRRKGGAPGRANTEELEWLAEEGKKAKAEFVTANLRLVVSIARKLSHGQMPFLDMVQEGNAGLIHAVEKFDYTKGYKFSTYGTWWIRQAIARGIAQQARLIRLPVHTLEDVNQMNGASRNLERLLGREPEPDEIATELGIDVDRVLDLMAWGKEHVSLDIPLGDDGDLTLGDIVAQEIEPGPDGTYLDKEASERLGELVKLLDDRSADIIRARYGLIDGRQYLLKEVGDRHGITAERVRQLEREALQKLRLIAEPDLAG